MFSRELAKLILTNSLALSPKLDPGTKATPFSSSAMSENFFHLIQFLKYLEMHKTHLLVQNMIFYLIYLIH